MTNRGSPRVALGQARNTDAGTAGREAARQARAQLPAAPLGWALVLAGGQHEAQALVQGLRAELGDLPLVGGCGVGLITAAGATSTGYECGVLLFPGDLAPTAVISRAGLDLDEMEAGRALGADLAALGLGPETAVLLFYDSIKDRSPPSLHIGSRLLDGLYQGLAGRQPLLIGAGTLADLGLTGSYVLDGRGPARHTAVAVVLPPRLRCHTTITHGCAPASSFLEITRIEGARVLELDGEPALGVVAQRLGVSREELCARRPLPSLTLGEKHGDPYAPFDEGRYVNRLVMAVDPADDALVLFEADFQVGTRVQLMGYEPWQMIESADRQTRALLAGLGEVPPLCALYIDCAGRSMAFSGMAEDETTPVRTQLRDVCPLLGFYSGVEIGPFLGRSRPLDWTGVLALFTEAP